MFTFMSLINRLVNIATRWTGLLAAANRVPSVIFHLPGPQEAAQVLEAALTREDRALGHLGPILFATQRVLCMLPRWSYASVSFILDLRSNLMPNRMNSYAHFLVLFCLLDFLVPCIHPCTLHILTLQRTLCTFNEHLTSDKKYYYISAMLHN